MFDDKKKKNRLKIQTTERKVTTVSVGNEVFHADCKDHTHPMVRIATSSFRDFGQYLICRLTKGLFFLLSAPHIP